MNKLSYADKTHGFRNEVVDKYVASKALNYALQQLTLVDCDLEMSEKENEELQCKLVITNKVRHSSTLFLVIIAITIITSYNFKFIYNRGLYAEVCIDLRT